MPIDEDSRSQLPTGDFVEVQNDEDGSFSIGKLIGFEKGGGIIEFFDVPFSPIQRCVVASNKYKKIILPKKTRVYLNFENQCEWMVGNLVEITENYIVKTINNDIQKASFSEIFTRRNWPIYNPNLFLSYKMNDNASYMNNRDIFVRNYYDQRIASLSIKSLPSSLIEIKTHQVEVCRRILRDPVQRYLLADEVGLGKTIEAGILVRQYVIDCPQDHSILIITPPTLVQQWYDELTDKFNLGEKLDKSIHIIASDNDAIRSKLDNIGMLIVDEAHLLTDKWLKKLDESLYESISVVAPTIERLLLISATPALHNEQSFFALLHLIDPVAYPLEAVEDFREKVKHRQILAEAVSQLNIDGVFFIEDALITLETTFGRDTYLQSHIDKIREQIKNSSDSSKLETEIAINNARNYISEVYRLDRRILRNQRINLKSETLERSGFRCISYSCDDVRYLMEDIEEWRIFLSNYENKSNIFNTAIDKSIIYPIIGNQFQSLLSRYSQIDKNYIHIKRISERFNNLKGQSDRLLILTETIKNELLNDTKIIVFCSDRITADKIRSYLSENLEVLVDRHALDTEEQDMEHWRRFINSPEHRVLICDRRAEEGLNLQRGKKTIIHYDLPISPNRIEQRLGRVDRIGASHAVESILLCCEDNPYEVAWIKCLTDGFRVFERSIANLQYLIEDLFKDIGSKLLVGGIDALSELFVQIEGSQGIISKELKRIEQFNALDALSSSDSASLDSLLELDNDWKQIQMAFDGWCFESLQLKKMEIQSGDRSNPCDTFSIKYSDEDTKPPLIPIPLFMKICGRSPRHTLPATFIPQNSPSFTFRRSTVTKQSYDEVNLLRYGDQFYDGIYQFTERDDRGKASAIWRFHEGFKSFNTPDIFFRFDFKVEVNLQPIYYLFDRMNETNRTNISAISRMADSMLPPTQMSIWVDSELNVTYAPELLELLNRPYQRSLTVLTDLNIDQRRWEVLKNININVADFWAELCLNAQEKAVEALKSSNEFKSNLKNGLKKTKQIGDNRIQQIETRVRFAKELQLGSENLRLDFEKEIISALQTGVDTPLILIDAVRAIFISGDKQISKTIKEASND